MHKSHFCKQIEKRVRKDIRIHKLFKKDDIIYVEDKLSKLLIEKIIGTLPKTFTRNKRKATKIVLKYTLDDEGHDFLEHLFYNKKEKEQKGISVLKSITDKDALLFAKYHKLEFKPHKKNKTIKEFIDKLENSYPQTRFSLGKSIESLK